MCLCIAGHLFATDNHTNNNKIMEEKLNLTQELKQDIFII